MGTIADATMTEARASRGAEMNIHLLQPAGIMVSLKKSLIKSAKVWYTGGPTRYWNLARSFR